MISRISITLFVLLLLAIAPLIGAPSAAVDSLVQAIDQTLIDAEADGFSGVILLRAHNQNLLHRAYGHADQQRGRHMQLHTGFDIGSLVKPITAAAVLRLAQEQKLTLNDSLPVFFEGVPADKNWITIRRLLTHTAGLRDIFGGDYQLIERDSLLAKVLVSKLINTPGTKESYSNAGYSVLAMIIEEVSGQSYEDFVIENILKPVGITRLGYRYGDWNHQELAAGIWRNGKRFGSPLEHAWYEDGPSWNLRGNGGMLGTATEMCQFYEALFDGKILDEAHLAIYYDFDAGESKSLGGLALFHAGGNDVFNTIQLSFIAHDVHLTMFSNDGKHEAEQVWKQFRKSFIKLATHFKQN